MSWCASCGLALSGTAALCAHHAATYGSEWARGNMIWCAFFHRGIVPQRLSDEDRADEWWREEVAPR